MTAAGRSGRRPVITAFATWFAHFMLCWAAVEIWPDGARANVLAWGFTGIALLVVGLHGVRLQRSAGRGEIAVAARRVARGAFAIATVAILFTALPSFVFLR